MTIEFNTSELRAVRREARLLLINATGAGYMLVNVGVEKLAGLRDAMSTSNWILVGLGCFCLAVSVMGGHTLLRVASIYRHLAKSRVIVVGALAFVCGSTLGGALAWLRAQGFQLAMQFENPTPARVLLFLLLIAAGWLISTALMPLLLNRRSLQ